MSPLFEEVDFVTKSAHEKWRLKTSRHVPCVSAMSLPEPTLVLQKYGISHSFASVSLRTLCVSVQGVIGSSFSFLLIAPIT